MYCICSTVCINFYPIVIIMVQLIASHHIECITIQRKLVLLEPSSLGQRLVFFVIYLGPSSLGQRPVLLVIYLKGGFITPAVAMDRWSAIRPNSSKHLCVLANFCYCRVIVGSTPLLLTSKELFY